MSLLLDALKKAADDKNKKSSHSSINEPADNLPVDEEVSGINEIPVDSLELELEPDAADINTVESSDDFPEVDQVALAQSKTQAPADQATQTQNSSSPDNSEDDSKSSLEESPVETTDESSLSDTVKDIETSNNQIPASAEHPTENSEQQQAASKSADAGKNDGSKHKNSLQVENERALSALINKSNQHSRSEQLKKTITIAVLVGLILFGSGLYFFIEMQASSQDLYIAQNNNAPIKRNTPILQTQTNISQQPAQAVKAEPVAVKKATQITPIRPQIQTPVVKKSRAQRQAAKKPISIVRTQKLDPVYDLLRDAYNAFQNQDYRQSEKLYNQVLKREPRNRDALLGVAAIGIKEQRYEYSRQKYQQLLNLNPRDSIAISGLSNIANRVDSQLNESQLKFMLKQQPGASHLYFSLGSLYASQKKWPEAQSAFFSAWSADNTNADYAYNLAVSLDHLDKASQAKGFYQLSLNLIPASGGNFSATDAQDRIRTLQEAHK